MIIIPFDRAGSSLLLDVGIASPRNYAGAANPSGTFRAVFDTGADASFISPALARVMIVPELGRQPVQVSGGKISFDPIHDIRICLGGHLSENPWHPLLVTSTFPATEGVEVVLGMDLLLMLNWHWDGDAGKGSIVG